jgi:hypoxanthine-guanine phosphoribosyltransferase
MEKIEKKVIEITPEEKTLIFNREKILEDSMKLAEKFHKEYGNTDIVYAGIYQSGLIPLSCIASLEETRRKSVVLDANFMTRDIKNTTQVEAKKLHVFVSYLRTELCKKHVILIDTLFDSIGTNKVAKILIALGIAKLDIVTVYNYKDEKHPNMFLEELSVGRNEGIVNFPWLD